MFRLLFATLRYIIGLLLWPLHQLTRKRCDVLRFTLKGSPPPLPRRRGFFFDRRPPPMSLRTFQRRLMRAIKDEALPCILVDIYRLETGWSTLQTMHELIAKARREGGKRVVAYLPEGGGLREYYVAVAADEIWLAPSTALSLTGLNIESTYFAPAFERFGIRAQVEAIGRYKTAGETFINREMTPENLEMLGEILDEIETTAATAIDETRKLGPVTSRDLLSRGPYSPARAMELGLIDNIHYSDNLSTELGKLLGTERRAKIRRWPSYSKGRHILASWPIGRKRLPVVELDGVLVEGRNRGLKSMVGAKDVVKLLGKLRKDPSVAAVVLHVNSRGGTVGASDQIRRAVERLGEKKPVIAYMSEVAASGGYMVSAAAQQIVAQPMTLTGSIGVLAGKVSGRRLLESLGLHRQSMRRGANAAFDSVTDGWTASERRALRELIGDHYDHFVNVVARGRRIPIEQVLASAEGRVWTGRMAMERGLVDTLGGLDRAIALARETSPEAHRALLQPLRPPTPRVPQMLLPQSIASALAWVEVAESSTSWAIEPFELRIQ